MTRNDKTTRASIYRQMVVATALLLATACAVPLAIPPDAAPKIAGPSANVVYASLGKAEIKVPVGSPMAGYGDRFGHKSTGSHDQIFARCVILKSGDSRIAIVSADILIMTQDLRARVLEKVADLKLDKITLATTHTHASVGGYVNSLPWEVAAMGTYNQKLFDLVADSIERSIRDAAKAEPFEARIAAGSTQVPDFIRNRRHDGGPTDPTLSVLRIDDATGKTRCLIANYGAHGTVMSGKNLEISGEYPGEVERVLERKVDLALFLTSDLGDQKPHRPGKDEDPSTFDDIAVIGGGVAEKALEVSNSLTPKAVDFEVVERRIELPPGDLNKACFGVMHAPLEAMGKRILQKSTLFQSIRIGDALFLTSPGEMAHEVGTALRDRFPAFKVFPTSHANDYIGYVVSKEEYAKGGYESCMNFYGPGMVDVLLDTLGKLGDEATGK